MLTLITSGRNVSVAFHLVSFHVYFVKPRRDCLVQSLLIGFHTDKIIGMGLGYFFDYLMLATNCIYSHDTPLRRHDPNSTRS